MSTWSHIPLAPPDAILGLNVAFRKDTDANKVNVGVGAYRDDSGKPYVLPVVQKAKKAILSDENDTHEYAGIDGNPGFVKVAEEFCFGEDCSALKENRVASVQGLSGTGCLRVAGEFLTTWLGAGRICYQPDPTWGNHKAIFQNAGMAVEAYRYYDRKQNKLDFAGMVDDIRAAPDGAIILLHACAHNPTGMDPSIDEWAELSSIFREKGHIPFFDNAYQGFASGDAEKDAYAIRHFVKEGHSVIVSNSFSKNFGLYGMADRIGDMRKELKRILIEDLKSEHNWDHITSQIGMFCFSGLDKEEVGRMISEKHIYMTGDGRISMAGVTTGNVRYIAESLHDVKSNTKAKL
eukprot:g69.t1